MGIILCNIVYRDIMKIKSLVLATLIVAVTTPTQAAVSAFSRSNCYVPIAEIGWESVTWGWPESYRGTSTWHLKDGEHPNDAHNMKDDFRTTWRSFVGDSHGLANGWDNKYTVKGKHWWSKSVPHKGLFWFKNSVATDCNLSQW
ncbi:hypothetical protein HQQ94_13440 [Shewanella sp. VB17]|uniref:hypothetical protein n=1 Tax=Shewanella sp. VB17 TaxID=2739432 RepID=UPI001562FFF9|nr:hypothetical protein [Shewanella sp. VB17]NRD74221.1 hypothetical protein [Shewanella sp. VB17]